MMKWNVLTDFGKKMLSSSYLLPGETPEDLVDRVIRANVKDEDRINRLKEAMFKGWWCPATPALSNSGTNRGLPISCFKAHTGDSKQSIFDAYTEDMWLASYGGGIGRNWSAVREVGAKVGIVGESGGIIPFLKISDAITSGVSQGNLRRGSEAVYLDVSHPEIEEFIDLRRNTGASIHRRCINLHHGINISDKFMEAVINEQPWDLISPKDGRVVKTVDAFELFVSILEARIEKGEPYLFFIDTANRSAPELYKLEGLTIKHSNLCVAPETLILTDAGYEQISALDGENVNVWNGQEWSNVKITKTGSNQKLIKVITDSGFELDCTPYHKFYVIEGYTKIVEKRACELKAGDKLIKSNFPVIQGTEELKYAYENGFYSGDGCLTAQGKRIYLYHDKRKLKPFFDQTIFKRWYVQEDQNREYGDSDLLLDKFFVPLGNYTVESKLRWFAGLCDSNGTVVNNGPTQSIQVCNTNKNFLLEVQMMLQTLGVYSKVTQNKEEGISLLPLNDGSGCSGEFNTKATYRLLIGQSGIVTLKSLGFTPFRLILTDHIPNRECSHYVKVKEVIDEGRVDDTYCFTEPKRHMGVFNGILTGQCSEIMLATDTNRTAVCNLSSLNMEKYDEWKGNYQFIEDVMYFLDGMINQFEDKIREMPEKVQEAFSKALNSALDERSVGLGLMGFHGYLQSKNIPFESAMASGINRQVFKFIRDAADKASQKIAEELGPCPLAARHGKMERFTNKLAVAPTASISIICGEASPGIDPILSNAYVHENKTGSTTVKNKWLSRVIDEYAEKHSLSREWIDEQWREILRNNGSVQSLEWMDDWTKDVFKTAYELDQRWIIDHASVRQEFIDQGQSVNLFLPHDISKKDLLGIHIYAWKKKLKALYYCRSTSVKRAMIGQKVEREVIEEDNKYEICLSCQ